MSPHSQSGKETTTLTPNPDVAKPLDLTAAGCYLQHLHLAVLETDEATEKARVWPFLAHSEKFSKHKRFRCWPLALKKKGERKERKERKIGQDKGVEHDRECYN